MLRKLNTRAKGIFLRLTEGLVKVGSHRKIDNGGTTIMAVHVEVIGATPRGRVVSVTHYYEQNGDLMRDPDMTFLVGLDTGDVYPLTFQQDSLGAYHVGAEIDFSSGSVRYNARRQADMTRFANTWMRNILAQQSVTGKDLATLVAR